MTETPGTLADFDRDFDAKTLAIATAPNQAAIIAALGPDAERYASDTESLYAFAFGHMRERARVTLERLRAAETRVAELEAERIAARQQEICGASPYPAGSEGDDGTSCGLPAGHFGDHDDMVPENA